MKSPLSELEPKCAHWALRVLTGLIIATAVIILLGSKNVGGMQLQAWQTVAIYAVLIAGSEWVGRRNCAK